MNFALILQMDTLLSAIVDEFKNYDIQQFFNRTDCKWSDLILVLDNSNHTIEISISRDVY